jgi:arylsulfatase A-like enzyme
VKRRGRREMGKLSRRDFIRTALAASAGLTALRGDLSVAEAKRAAKHPNLVCVFPDEMRRQAMACMDADPVITPNLDRLASEGMVLTQAVSNFPVCSPYRGMLFTGKYPFSNGVIHNCLSAPFAETSYLRTEDRCLSDVLSDAGHNCGYIGKWHLERPHEPYVEPPRPGDGYVWDEFTPPERRHRFDFWYAYNCYDGHLTPHYWTTEATREDKTEIREWSVKHEADIAIEYIENRDGKHRDSSKPFALFVAHNPPHMPFQLVPEKYVEMYGDQGPEDLLTRPNVDLSIEDGPTAQAKRWVKHYFAAVTGIDENLGRILDCLKEQGLEDNTIVVFASDHGEMMGSHNLMYKNQIYEESFGVPFLIRYPPKIAAGSRDDILLSAPDVMPTLLGLMGLAAQIPEQVEGADHSDVLRGQSAQRPELAVYMHLPPTNLARGRRGLRTAEYTVEITRNDRRESVKLFDNEKDPYQMENIADDREAVAEELTKKLNEELLRIGDPWVGA